MQISKLSDRVTFSALALWGVMLVVFTLWLQSWSAAHSLDFDVHCEAG